VKESTVFLSVLSFARITIWLFNKSSSEITEGGGDSNVDRVITGATTDPDRSTTIVLIVEGATIVLIVEGTETIVLIVEGVTIVLIVEGKLAIVFILLMLEPERSVVPDSEELFMLDPEELFVFEPERSVVPDPEESLVLDPERSVMPDSEESLVFEPERSVVFDISSNPYQKKLFFFHECL
jgi:hypothetical protein